jgi:hypothetical protein
MSKIIQTDDRGRASLGADLADRLFIRRDLAGGVELIPAEVVPAGRPYSDLNKLFDDVCADSDVLHATRPLQKKAGPGRPRALNDSQVRRIASAPEGTSAAELGEALGVSARTVRRYRALLRDELTS